MLRLGGIYAEYAFMFILHDLPAFLIPIFGDSLPLVLGIPVSGELPIPDFGDALVYRVCG